MEQPKNRMTKLIAVVGTNGTGKTTTIREIANSELKRNGKVLVITPHENEWEKFNNVPVPFVTDIKNMEGIGKIHYCGDFSVFERIHKEFFNGLLVFDDCRVYLKANTDQVIQSILISRRQRMTDIIFAAHSIVDIPVKFFYYDSLFILKRTTSSFEGRKRDINPELYDRLIEAKKRIDKKINKNPYAYELIKS